MIERLDKYKETEMTNDDDDDDDVYHYNTPNSCWFKKAKKLIRRTNDRLNDQDDNETTLNQ